MGYTDENIGYTGLPVEMREKINHGAGISIQKKIYLNNSFAEYLSQMSNRIKMGNDPAAMSFVLIAKPSVMALAVIFFSKNSWSAKISKNVLASST